MQGIERVYCNVCINALVGAWRALMDVKAVESLRHVDYGKGDTLGLDAITEITIKERLEQFDSHAILITEELDDQAHRRWPTDSDPVKQPLMFFCDPTDRSSQLKTFFEKISEGSPMEKIGDLMGRCDPKVLWEATFEPPACITGSTSAITCVRKGEVIFSVILNFITGVVYVATDIGVFWYRLKNFSDSRNENVDLNEIIKKGQQLLFPGVGNRHYSLDDCRRFVTFLGKEGYRANLEDSQLFVENENLEGLLHHSNPPGPPRVFYLSELQKKGYGPVGFILCNGEKIGEWMHWLAFIKYARNDNGGCALRVYEISLERPWTKNGMLMSTSSAYSIFCDGGKNGMFLDISQLRNFDRPSQFRCMMVVLPFDNERIIHVLKEHQFREVTNAF